MRFADTRDKREHREGPDLLGSSTALVELFKGGYPMQVVRQIDRKARRKALAKTWSRMVMARLPHPLVTLRAKLAELAVKAGRPVSEKAFRLAQPAPKFAPQPGLMETIERTGGRDRRSAKRAIRRAGYRWKAVSKRWRVRRGAAKRKAER